MSDLDLVLELPEGSVDAAFGEGAEAHCGDEMLTASGEHGRHRMPGLLEQPHELERLVSGNSPADDEQNASHGRGIAVLRRRSRGLTLDPPTRQRCCCTGWGVA